MGHDLALGRTELEGMEYNWKLRYKGKKRNQPLQQMSSQVDIRPRQDLDIALRGLGTRRSHQRRPRHNTSSRKTHLSCHILVVLEAVKVYGDRLEKEVSDDVEEEEFHFKDLVRWSSVLMQT